MTGSGDRSAPHRQVAKEPSSEAEREARFAQLASVLARHLPEATARELITQALASAGLTSVPPAHELPEFVDRHLSEALSARVGPAVAEHWLSALRKTLGHGAQAASTPRDAPQVTTAIDPWLGKVLATRYRLLQRVAEGRRGVLFRAERVTDGARVAIKLAEPQVYQSKERFAERFAHEVEQARSLEHANTLVVHEHGRADERFMFVAMEWLSGIDLARMLETRGPLNARQAMFLAHQTARSLADAHKRGVVHGDLTPSGIFVARHASGQSVVKVMDYGRRRLESYNDEGHSQVGMPKGWARHLSPEQITGADFDARADIYALGSILYQALSGELPFQDSTGIGILMSQVHDRPPLLRAHTRARDVGDQVEQLVMRCLEKDPEQRFESADELVELTAMLAR